MTVYLTSFGGLTFLPHFRGKVMAFTGIGLEKRLTKVKSEPSILEIVPEVITLEKTREIEIWGNTLLLNGKPPKVTIAGSEVKVKAFSNNKIVLDVAKLNISEGSTNLELTYDEERQLPTIIKVQKPSVPPDLVITNFTLSPSNPIRRRNTKATISVKNNGNTEANNFILEWKPTTNDTGKKIKVHNLQPGESRDFSDNFSYSNLGTFDTLVTIDPNQIIPESNEANNSIAKQITVKKALPKRLIVRVWLKKVTIEDDADFWNNGEVNLFFNINNQKLNWYRTNAESGKTYNINKVLTVIVNESENLKISVNGFDKDGDSEDSMGIINKKFSASSNWGKGNHNHRSSCPKGCYKIHYTIDANWVD